VKLLRGDFKNGDTILADYKEGKKIQFRKAK